MYCNFSLTVCNLPCTILIKYLINLFKCTYLFVVCSLIKFTFTTVNFHFIRHKIQKNFFFNLTINRGSLDTFHLFPKNHSLKHSCIIHFILFDQISSKPEGGSICEEEDSCSEGESDGGEVGLLQGRGVRTLQLVAIVLHHLLLFSQTRHGADVLD